jgi:cytochrome o ubiquinol oxidase subunit 2
MLLLLKRMEDKSQKSSTTKKILLSFGILIVVLAFVLLLKQFFPLDKILLLNPKGIIALKERNLMILATLLMLIIVIPVFVATFLIVWKYRADKNGKTNAVYQPEWEHNVTIETIWWLIPLAIVFVLSVITWQSSYALSPYKPLASESGAKPIIIQVVALDWKWLFIYPAENIATVNFVEFPAGTPVNFELTSDAPMNSFFIPQLGGQMYAMPGMSTDLHLESFKPGTYNGLSANISGAGFAGMKFVAKAVSQTDFDQWLATVKRSPNVLSLAQYNKLAAVSQNNPVTIYSSVEPNLYASEVEKYMMSSSSMQEMPATQAMPAASMSGMMMGN